MSLNLKPGTRLYSAVCETQMIAVKAPSDAIELTIGGAPARTQAAATGGAVAEGPRGGSHRGQSAARYLAQARCSARRAPNQ